MHRLKIGAVEIDLGHNVRCRRVRSGFVLSRPGYETKTKSSLTAAIRYYNQILIDG